VAFQVRDATPADIPELMRLKHQLAAGENALHVVRASAEQWLRDGFGPNAGFTAFVAEMFDAEPAGANIASAGPTGSKSGGSVIGMATCSRRLVTGWDGPVLFLQDLYVDEAYRRHGVARALAARVAALARDIGSPIIELTVHSDNPARKFYERSGFMELPTCLTYVLAGPALAALAGEHRPVAAD
jgi:ribosomal protein S18 acetylase RimI-like enzyme